MFDIGWPELFLIAVVVLLVVGPKELPKVLRNVGVWVGKSKVVTREFRTHIDDMIRENELEEVRGQIESAGQMDLDSITQNTIGLQDDIDDVIVDDSNDDDVENDSKYDVETINSTGDLEASKKSIENDENTNIKGNDGSLGSIKSDKN